MCSVAEMISPGGGGFGGPVAAEDAAAMVSDRGSIAASGDGGGSVATSPSQRIRLHVTLRDSRKQC